MGFHCGFRIEEIVECRPDWFDFIETGATVSIQKTETFIPKNKKNRTLPLNSKCFEFIKDYGMRKPFMLLPKIIHGKQRLRVNLRKRFKQYVASYGLEWVSFHTMRHTFASLHTMAGTNPMLICLWAGMTFKTYEQNYAGLKPVHESINAIV